MKSVLFLILAAGFSANAIPSDYLEDLAKFQSQNLSMAVEKGKLKASEDYHLAKKLFWTPELELSQGKTRIERKGTAPAEVDYWQANATLNIFKGGADLALLDQADAAEKSQLLAVKNEELRTDVMASGLIFKSIYLKESLRIQEELYKLKEDALKIVKDRYAGGKTPLQDVTKAEVDLSQQKNKLRLATLTLGENDVAIKAAFVDSVKSQSWPFTDKETLTVAAKSESVKFPSIEQKYWSAKSGEAGWKASQRSYWPKIDLSIQYQESPIKERTTQEWTSLLTLKIPLWSKYETASSVSQAYADFLTADAEFKRSEQAAKLNSEFLVSKVEVARVNLTDAKKNLQKSKDLYRDLVKIFSLGRLSTNDLLLEQGRLLESESNLVDAQLSFHQTVVEFCSLQGLRITECAKD